MNTNTLRKKAHAHTLEVEDLLAAAARRTPGLQAELLRLSAELAWPHTTHPTAGGHAVPLAAWAGVAGAYAEDGIPGLAAWMQAQARAGMPACYYVLSLLQELKTQESNDALFSLFGEALDNPASHLAEAFELAETINLKFSFKHHSPPPTPTQSERARAFLMALYPLAPKEPLRCSVVCALRGVGDESTVRFLATIPPFGGPYAGLEKSAQQAIRKRLRSTAAASA